MKKKHFIVFYKIRKAWRKISLKDKILIVFITILLGQCIANLFINELNTTGEIVTVDMIFSTSTASILGYFLSSNFLRHSPSTKPTSQNTKVVPSCKEDPSPTDDEPLLVDESMQNIQIFIAGAIGLLSLIILIIARNFALPPSGSAPTLGQLRGFLSGCLGFLLGYSHDSERSKRKK